MKSEVFSRSTPAVFSGWRGALAVVMAISAVTISSQGQTPAFPGALGFGAYAAGGRNGTLYVVTNLNDSGPGSFRDAVSSANRTIVFDVGGNIRLLSAVSCKGDLTIAGQTAPGGISFDGGEISFANRDNIICRFIRIRPGSDTVSTTDDCISLYRARNAIFDHVSMEFGPWNNVDGVSDNWQTYPVTDITFQHCIDADPIYQQFGAHTESVSSDWTWCYNIFANSHNRNPLAKVNNVFINNIEYNNSDGYTTHTSTSFKHDIVNNYFVSGPASGGGTSYPWYQVDNNQSIYCSGNYLDANKNGALDGIISNIYWYQGGGTVLSSPWSSWTSIIPTMPTALAWRYGISAAGAFPRDEVDSLVISQMTTLGNGVVGTGVGSTGPDGSLYKSQTETGLSNDGYGTITGGTAPANFSGDGIADYWKLANNLSTNIYYPLTNTADGYTLLEHYLNFLAAPHTVTQTNTPVGINLTKFTSGFSADATFSQANATNGTVTLLNGTNAQFVPATDFSGLGGFNFTVDDSGYTLTVTVTICVTPVAPPASATNFNGALIGVSVAATAPPRNLLWHGDDTANVWNTSVSNWLNGASVAAFRNGDVVTFDDTGSSVPAINLTTTVLPGAMFFDDDQDYTLSGSGALSGSGSFSKTGTGTLTIGTINSSFSGAINLSGGTVALNSGTSIGSGAITLSGGANLSLPNPIASPISGSVNVPAGDTGTITSAHVANGGYGILISGDTNSVLNLVGNQSFGGSSSSQFSAFNGTIHIVSGNVRFSTASSGNTFGSLTPNFIIDGSLQPRNAGNTIILGALNGSGLLQGPQTANTGTGSTVYNIGGKNQDAIFTGSILSNANSAGSLICFNKVGTGTQTLMGNNTFGGTNGVLAGTLLIDGTSMASLTTVSAGATLGGTGVINGPVTVNAGGVLSPGDNGAGTFTINGNLTNTSPILHFDLSGSPSGANDRINLAGTLAMTGAQTFDFNLTDNALGAGTYDLVEGATYSTQSGVSFASNLPGNTRQGISLVSATAGSNPSYVRLIVTGTADSLVWLGTNGSSWDTSTINWLNGTAADRFYNLDSVTFDDTSTNGTVALAGDMQPGTILVNNNSLPYTFSGNGALSGSGTLTKTGSGTLTVATTNSAFTGNIFVNGGALAVSNGASLGSGMLSLADATLTLPASGSSLFLDNPVSVPANQTATITSGILSSGFSGIFSSGNSASVLNLSGEFSFGGTTPAQFNSFTGTIHVMADSTMRFSANSSGNTYGSPNSTLIIDGTLQPRNAGNTIQLGAFSGTGTLTGPQSNGGSGDTLYVIGGNDTSAIFSGIISSNTAVAGSEVIVNKIGDGTLTLTGANTFTGGTTVSAGTLCVNNTTGSATGKGDLEIFSGATFTGSGIVGSTTTIDNGATLAPGDPSGELTISNSLTLNDSSLLLFSLGTNSDTIAVSGDLALTGQLTVTNSGGFGPRSYTLFTHGGALDLGNFQIVSVPSGYNYSLDTNTPGQVKLVVTNPSPYFSATSLSAGNLLLSGSGGAFNGTYYVLTSTNLALPLANWTRLLTNQFDADGDFNVTNPLEANSPQHFYLLELP